MQTVEFTMDEIEVLREVLQHKIEEAGIEMSRTDTHNFKEMLKRRRQLLDQMLNKVSSVPIAA
jgi:predicted DNA-binding protein (UPF0251 family)